jgi:DNA-binding beta-propeller fold protein YncE
MKNLQYSALVAALFAICGNAFAAPPDYHVVKQIPLGPPDKWDFVHFDVDTARVYVAHGTEITIIDAKSGAVAGRIPNIAGAHDVAIVPVLGRGYADNGHTGSVTVFDLSTFKIIGQIPADNDADAMLYDLESGKLAVANGDAHSVSIIDPKAGMRLANVALPGSPEMMAANGAGKIYINIASANEIVRLDLASAKLDAELKIPACESPHGLALDRVTHRLFVSCHNSKMLAVNAENGKVVADLPIGNGTDSAAFDPERKFAFSANKDGTLSVIEEKNADNFVALGNVPTAPGARTMAEDPKTGRVYLVTADVARTLPPRKPGGDSQLQFAPGSVKLLMLEPGK